MAPPFHVCEREWERDSVWVRESEIRSACVACDADQLNGIWLWVLAQNLKRIEFEWVMIHGKYYSVSNLWFLYFFYILPLLNKYFDSKYGEALWNREREGEKTNKIVLKTHKKNALSEAYIAHCWHITFRADTKSILTF